MKTKFSFLLVLLLIIGINAKAQQTKRATIGLITFLSELNPENKKVYAFDKQEIPLKADPFLALSLSWEATNWEKGNNEIWYRLYEHTNTESDWIQAKVDPHADQIGNKWISQLYFEKKENKFIDLKIVLDHNSTVSMNNVVLNFFSPGKSKKNTDKETQEKTTTVTCPCPQPQFETRQDWCPAGNCPPNPDPSPTTVSHLIVHHSAGTNASSDWAGVVRSIWDYHVNTNGWSDIGYNWLVDPNGVLYEGRGDNILGAHFCGTNTGTMGVCVMGDFTNISPTDDAKSILTDLLSWKICDINADPLGSSFHAASSQTLNNISGHQDGCSTECPGNTFYPELGTVRNNVNDHIATNCEASGLLPPTDLEGIVVSNTSIQLDWQDNSSTEINFVVERSINSNSNYQQVGTTNTDIATFTDVNLTPNTAYFYRVKATNDQEDSDYSNELGIATIFTGLEELENVFELKLYPNPTSNWLNMEASQQLSLQLLDYSGKLIGSYELHESLQVDMSRFARGLYLLKATNGKQEQSHRVMRF